MTEVLIAVFIADAGCMMHVLLFIKYMLIALVVSLVCDFMCAILLMSALMGQ